MKTNKVILLIGLLVLIPSFTLSAQRKKMSERDRTINSAHRFLRGAGVEMSYKKAYMLFKKYAEQGDGEATNAIGMMFKRGLGLQQNDQKAYEYFLKAANSGYAKGAYNIGLMYKFGNYVTQNQDSATHWIEKAKTMGYNKTDYNLGHAYYKGHGKKQNYRKAIQHYQAGAEKGDAACMFSLGYCYYKGRGTERNPELGKYWIEKAAESGYSRAADFIARNDSKNFGKKEMQLRSISTDPISRRIPLRHSRIRNKVAEAKIVGEWEGKLVNYDWSGEEIEKETPLKVILQQNGRRIDGLWIENETDPVRIDAMLKDTIWSFDNTQLYENQRPLSMQRGSFILENKDGEEYLTGDISYYCETTKENMPPSYIILQRKSALSTTIINSDSPFKVYPNPVNDELSIDFSIDKTQKISVSIFDINGKKIYADKIKEYAEGNHTIKINTTQFSSGNYIVRLVGESINKSSKIIKQ